MWGNVHETETREVVRHQDTIGAVAMSRVHYGNRLNCRTWVFNPKLVQKPWQMYDGSNNSPLGTCNKLPETKVWHSFNFMPYTWFGIYPRYTQASSSYFSLVNHTQFTARNNVVTPPRFDGSARRRTSTFIKVQITSIALSLKSLQVMLRLTFATEEVFASQHQASWFVMW